MNKQENHATEFLRLLRDDKRTEQILKECIIKAITQSFLQNKS